MVELLPWVLGAGVLLLMVAARSRELWAPDAAEPGPVDLENGQAEQGQGGGFDVAAFMATFDPVTYMPSSVTQDQADANLAAFLLTIRKAEGTSGPNGYRTLFGGGLFVDFGDHPRRAARFTDKAGRRLWTSAAGAYQFMAVSALPDGGFTKVDTWDRLQRKLSLPDFSPASQDAAAIELIREAGALDMVREGAFDEAVSKVRRIWASMPGAGYSQPEKSLTALRQAYANAGGVFA